jgi:ubiquinone/menaquinone biosynthesis C-methylase UbiE
MEPETKAEDRFASVAAAYDRFIRWGPRLQKEMPFLLASLPPGGTILDVGCGTGAHALALAEKGYHVTGLDRSSSMLEQARASTRRPAPEWILGDVLDSAVLPGAVFDGVLALGNVLHSFQDEEEATGAIARMVERVALGGTLILQYLNGGRIRQSGRLVVKDAGGGGEQDPTEIWLRHHFVAGESLYFHSYVLHREGSRWSAEVRAQSVVDLPGERVAEMLRPAFESVELFDGLTGGRFVPLESDAIGVRGRGRREAASPGR